MRRVRGVLAPFHLPDCKRCGGPLGTRFEPHWGRHGRFWVKCIGCIARGPIRRSIKRAEELAHRVRAA